MFESFSEFLYKGFVGRYLEINPASSQTLLVIIMILCYLLSMIVPYLLGSINTAILVSKHKYGDDIRNHGSGNAGLTNVLRTYGKKAALITLAGDTLKAVVSVAFGYLFMGYQTAYIAALFCMLGHMFPCYYRFKGGKGVLVSAASLLLLDPITLAIELVIFIILVAGTKFVSLGSIMAALLMPLILSRIANMTGNVAVALGLPAIISIIMAVLVVFMHRKNIKRLLNGTENKISFKKKAESSDGSESPEEGNNDDK